MHEHIGAGRRHRRLEVQLVIAGCVRSLGQTRKILADPRPVAVRRDQPGKPLGHSQDVECAGEDCQADGGIASLETLERLDGYEHALGHEALGELPATTRKRDVLAQSRNRALALGRQSAGSS